MTTASRPLALQRYVRARFAGDLLLLHHRQGHDPLAGLNSGTDPRAKPNEALDVAILYVLARPHDARQSLGGIPRSRTSPPTAPTGRRNVRIAAESESIAEENESPLSLWPY
jgi:hypothetical protein